MQAAAGRLLATPSFLADRDRLKALWQKLPTSERPPLPLYPVCRATQVPPDATALPADSLVSEFWTEFKRFCHEHQLLHLATWSLPFPQGPELTGILSSKDEVEQGTMRTRIPFHFPLQKSDDAGTAVSSLHTRQNEERGIHDQGKWESYASMLLIAHWEHVLLNRYLKSKRVPQFVAKLEGKLAAMLGLSPERAQRLRLWLRHLRTSKLQSLASVR
jgi:hypothetical protein